MNYRHGDMALISVKTLPKGLISKKTDVLMIGNSNTHRFKGGKFYPKTDGDFVFGYLVAKNTHLLHPEHGGDVKIADGIYELRKQCEDTNEGMKQVID